MYCLFSWILATETYLGSVVLFHHVNEVMTTIVGGNKQCPDIFFERKPRLY
jgi:hypothetical protein